MTEYTFQNEIRNHAFNEVEGDVPNIGCNVKTSILDADGNVVKVFNVCWQADIEADGDYDLNDNAYATTECWASEVFDYCWNELDTFLYREQLALDIQEDVKRKLNDHYLFDIENWLESQEAA